MYYLTQIDIKTSDYKNLSFSIMIVYLIQTTEETTSITSIFYFILKKYIKFVYYSVYE